MSKYKIETLRKYNRFSYNKTFVFVEFAKIVLSLEL